MGIGQPGRELTAREVEAIATTGPMAEAIYKTNPTDHLARRLDQEGWQALGAAELGGGLRATQFANDRFTGNPIDFTRDVRNLVNTGGVRKHLDRDGQQLWDETAGLYQSYRGDYNGIVSKANAVIRTSNSRLGTSMRTLPTAPRLGDLTVSQMRTNGVDMTGELNAMVLRQDDTLVLGFRGSVTGGDGWAAAFDQDRFYESGRPLYDAVLDYASDPANGIKNVYVTGHSLGGAMTQMFSYRDLPRFAEAGLNVQAVAYASPGVQAADAPAAGQPPANLITVQGIRDNVANQQLELGPNDVLDMTRQVMTVRNKVTDLRDTAIKRTSGVWGVSGLVEDGLILAGEGVQQKLDRLQRLAANTESTALQGHQQWDGAEIYYDFPHRPDNRIADWDPQHSWVRSRQFSELLGTGAEGGASFRMGQVVGIDDRGTEPSIIGPPPQPGIDDPAAADPMQAAQPAQPGPPPAQRQAPPQRLGM